MAQPKHILSERLGNERIVLDLARQEYLSLNPTGTVIWEGLDAGRSLAQIAQDVCDQFEADFDDVMNDVATFAEELQERGLTVGAF